MSAPLRKPNRKWHGPCIYRVREVLSPLQKKFRGFRFEVAVPNMDGHKPFSDTPAPSFSRSRMLFTSSDWNSDELDRQVQGAILFLTNRGFDKVEEASAYAERMLLEMLKGKTTHVEYEET